MHYWYRADQSVDLGERSSALNAMIIFSTWKHYDKLYFINRNQNTYVPADSYLLAKDNFTCYCTLLTLS
jgi:hypothetical protein